MINIPSGFRVPAAVAALLLVVACAGRTGRNAEATRPASAASPPSSASPVPSSNKSSPGWLTVDSAARTVTLTIEVTAPAGSPSALINGYRAGEARIIVPLGWTVKWNWRNTDPESPHSLVVMVQREKIPLEGGRPAFSNAMTRMVTSGLPPMATDETMYVADEAGWYWLLCGVPDHALNGEWLELRVDPDVNVPSLFLH